MADIAMCRGENCERREQCYRYTAPVSEYVQAVFTYTPMAIYPTLKSCPQFWDNEGCIDGREIGQWWKYDDRRADDGRQTEGES